MLIIMVVAILVMTIMLPGLFFTKINIASMASQFPEFGFLALAMMLAMITGGIDLSVVATANFTGVIAALILTKGPAAGMHPMLSIVLAIAAVIAFSVPCGLLNGVLIAFVGVPPILATLGTQGLYLGLATIITRGWLSPVSPSIFCLLERFYLWDTGRLHPLYSGNYRCGTATWPYAARLLHVYARK